MRAYKGFQKGLISKNGFKYEENKLYETKGELELCSNGFHASEDPIDCFRYYEPTSSNEFAAVTLDGEIIKEEKYVSDSKMCASKIAILHKMSIIEMIGARLQQISKLANKQSLGKLDETREETRERYYKEAEVCNNIYMVHHAFNIVSNTEHMTIMHNTDCFGIGNMVAAGTAIHNEAITTNANSISAVSGKYSNALAIATNSIAASSGELGISISTSSSSIAAITAGGSTSYAAAPNSIAASTGFHSTSIVDKENSCSIVTNGHSVAQAMHPKSLAIALGPNTYAMGVKGSYLLLSEYEYENEAQRFADNFAASIPSHLRRERPLYGSIKHLKLIKITGRKYKPGVLYFLKDGKVIGNE